MTTTKQKENAPGKRKRTEVEEVNDGGGAAVKPKKPHIEHQQPQGGDIISAALQKIAELEKLISAEDVEDVLDNDDSDYSDRDISSDCEEDVEEVFGQGNASRFNPELVGFAVCAQEAIEYLKSEGFDDENPLIVNMKNRLVHQWGDYQSTLNEDKKQ